MTTSETMTIRKALAEKALLDKKIEKLADMNLTFIYSTSEPYINGRTVEESKKCINSNFTSLNDMIKRREAINKAILNMNATATIRVKAFNGLDGFENSAEEDISLANAINRKNYYKGILLPMVAKFKADITKTYNNLDIATKQINNTAREIIENRYRDKTNMPKDLSPLIADEFKRIEPKLDGLENALDRVEAWQTAIEDYISNIDVELSGATERYTVVIEY